jgi:hypothetical protein
VTALEEFQFEILPHAEASDGFVFGIGADISVDNGGFDPGEVEHLTQDQQNTRRGVRSFGRDKRGPKTWLWTSHADQVDVETAVAVLDDFSAAWGPEAAEDPDWQTAIRYHLAGRTRRVFGRPRRYSAPPTNLILSGYVPVTHDFACVDGYTYSDEESSYLLPYISSVTGGGFSFPVTFPIETQASEGNGGGQISVGGNARAYPRIRFNGPWVNPVLTTDDWTLSWKGSIPADGWVEIDCRPWRLTVLNHSGASVVQGLDRQTWLEDCWFAAGSSPQIQLGGGAASGSASALVAFRDTWTSI